MGICAEDAVFLGSKRLLTKKSKKAARYWRNIGLGYAVPKEAKEGNYVDKKCPFTGSGSLFRIIFTKLCEECEHPWGCGQGHVHQYQDEVRA